MPFRMLLTSPITLAALAVVAVGIITYQILSNKQQKRLLASGRYSRSGGKPGNPNDGPEGPDKAGKGPRRSIQDAGYYSGDSIGAPNKVGSSPEESEKTGSDPNGLRKRTNVFKRLDDTSEPENHPAKYNNVNSSLSSFDRDSEAPSNISNQTGNVCENSEAPGNINNQTQNVSIQNRENQETDGNIRQINDKMTGFVPNISDEDSDSAESSNSKNSFKTDYSSTDSNASFSNNESSCTTEGKNIRDPSPIDSEEEIYKRKVCDNLKNDMKNENCSSRSYRDKYFEDFSDEDSDVSESAISGCSGATSNLSASPRKPKLCKGCLEEFANAVVYPCKHCYLCLDCAIKVHKIYKKCSICHLVIKTFERSDA